MKALFEKVIRERLRTDINDSFAFDELSLRCDDLRLTAIQKYLEYIKKLADSMPFMSEYIQVYSLFNIDYIKECYFERNSAGDHVRYL